MKYLRLYEQNSMPQIGDYVVCRMDARMDALKEDLKIFIDFFDNNIGRVEKMTNDNMREDLPSTYLEYPIVYTGVPKRMKDFFNYSDYRYMLKSEIVFWSKDKDDCEIYIMTNKYNL